jgi:hypothetical protein
VSLNNAFTKYAVFYFPIVIFRIGNCYMIVFSIKHRNRQGLATLGLAILRRVFFMDSCSVRFQLGLAPIVRFAPISIRSVTGHFLLLLKFLLSFHFISCYHYRHCYQTESQFYARLIRIFLGILCPRNVLFGLQGPRYFHKVRRYRMTFHVPSCCFFDSCSRSL